MSAAPAGTPHPGGNTRDRLVAMLLLVALLHGLVLLGVSFTRGDSAGTGRSGLEVLLVSDDLPEARNNEQATYLAQRTQHGSGTTSERTPARSPSAQGQPGTNQASSAEAAADNLLHSTRDGQPEIQYLPGVQSESAQAAVGEDLPGSLRDSHGDATELVLRGRLDRNLMAAPDTRASELAPYLTAWKDKVERIGTLNYPRAARQQNVTRNPTLEVTLDSRGRLLRASITRSSGQNVIDQAALDILKLASPFDPLPPTLAQRYRTLRFAYEWQFVP